jgi:Tfp pilus assembly pilus retraction ATPase PilT
MVELMLTNNAQGMETLKESGSTDISYSVNGLCRFCVNIFR